MKIRQWKINNNTTQNSSERRFHNPARVHTEIGRPCIALPSVSVVYLIAVGRSLRVSSIYHPCKFNLEQFSFTTAQAPSLLDVHDKMCLPCFSFSNAQYERGNRQPTRQYQYVWNGQAWVLHDTVSSSGCSEYPCFCCAHWYRPRILEFSAWLSRRSGIVLPPKLLPFLPLY